MRNIGEWTFISIKYPTHQKLMDLKDKWNKHNMDEVVEELLKVGSIHAL